MLTYSPDAQRAEELLEQEAVDDMIAGRDALVVADLIDWCHRVRAVLEEQDTERSRVLLFEMDEKIKAVRKAVS